MNNKVLTIALLVFALIFVVLLAVLMGTITSKTNAANTKLVDTLDMTEGMELSNYDGASIKGNSVINVINNGKSLGGKNKLWVYVETNRNVGKKASDIESYKVYGYGDVTGSGDTFKELSENSDFLEDGNSAVNDLTSDANCIIKTSSTYKPYSAPNSTASHYISESAEFRTSLVRNYNDVVVGVHIVQVSK